MNVETQCIASLPNKMSFPKYWAKIHIIYFLREMFSIEFLLILQKIYFSMARNEKELQGVTLLGNQQTKYQYEYTPEVLETFENKHPENEYIVTLDCPEFTSLCPKTGQPDFGHIIINYIPRIKMVESKSLKLYLFSFRNHGDFHEDCVNIIMKDLVKLMDPKYIEVIGLFNPRGGISIKPFANYGDEAHQDMVHQRMLNYMRP